ncbi:MAG: PEGA domain-containing protein [Lachnospiraceae bacterium]|nr:PEGA domain-containing protein [Lachnospiraceae bacterium]
MKGSGPKKCRLTFEIGVKGAKIYLDGKEVKKNKEMSVAYGDHSLTVVADGYDTWSRTLVVNSKNATIALDISDSKEGGSSSASSSSSAVSGKTSGTTSGTASSGATSSGSTSSSGTTSGTKDSGSSSSTSKSEKDKAEENYLSTLANSIVNSLSSSND